MFKFSFYLPVFLFLYTPLSAANGNLEPLQDDEAYVVISLIIEGHVPENIKLESAEAFGETYRAKDLKAGENFTVIKLPAGEYQWSRISLYNDRFFDLEDFNFKVDVKPGVINYGGHLQVKINFGFSTAQYNYVNRSSVVLDKLKQDHADIYGRYPLVFAGHSPDPFIAHFEELVNKRNGK